MWTRTKVICTMGPAVSSPEKIRELISAGMDVARLNFSHGTHEQHGKIIEMLKAAREELGVPLAIMLDTKGPEIRIGEIKGGELYIPTGHRWLLTNEELMGTIDKVSIRPSCVLSKFQEGMMVLFDNGYVISKVVEIVPEGAIVEILHGGVMKSTKGVNVPNVDLGLPAVSEKDIADIQFGCKMDIDIIAASFIRSPEHVIAVKELLKEQDKADIWVIAKIENSQGVDNLDTILQVSDGLMVARGDLGVEVPPAKVPRLQKMMIRKALLSGKPCVTATHMLESMITNPRPTRAETSDVANAIYDSTSAVMLSAETAIGKYPIEAVKMMKTIVYEAEQDFNYRTFFNHYKDIVFSDVTSLVTHASVSTAFSSNSAKAIFTFTTGGYTARLISRLRPSVPIVAMTSQEKCYHQLAFNWGVIPHFSTGHETVEQAFETVSHFAMKQGVVAYGDLVVITAGQPFGFSGTTNMMMIENIGEVLVRGHEGFGKSVHGNIKILYTLDQMRPYEARGSVLVITSCDESYLPYIKSALGVVLQNHVDDHASEKALLQFAEQLGKPVLIRADDATRTLKEGVLVTLDPYKKIVYKGVVI